MSRLAFCSVLLATSSWAAFTGQSDIEVSADSDFQSQDVGVVRIRCRVDQHIHFFRGTVIDNAQPESAWDVVLTTLHGLPDDVDIVTDRCVVVDAFGEELELQAVWLPPLRGRVSPSDWAVLLTEERIAGISGRLRVSATPSSEPMRLMQSGAPVRLPLFKPIAERPCGLIQSELTNSPGNPTLFAHTCRAWPGHSGSPILMSKNGRALLVGIHLGRRRNHFTGMQYGVGRAVDSTIIAAIDAAIERGNRD